MGSSWALPLFVLGLLLTMVLFSARAKSTTVQESEEAEAAKEEPWHQKKHRMRYTLTEEEVQAITKHNCSVAYLTFGAEEEEEEEEEEEDDDVVGREEEYEEEEEPHCLISLWFTGQYPTWLETPNFVGELERAEEKELQEFAPRVCECGILDIDEDCPRDVLEAAQTIIRECPEDQKVVTNLDREGRAYNPKKHGKGEGFTWSIFD